MCKTSIAREICVKLFLALYESRNSVEATFSQSAPKKKPLIGVVLNYQNRRRVILHIGYLDLNLLNRLLKTK